MSDGNWVVCLSVCLSASLCVLRQDLLDGWILTPTARAVTTLPPCQVTAPGMKSYMRDSVTAALHLLLVGKITSNT